MIFSTNHEEYSLRPGQMTDMFESASPSSNSKEEPLPLVSIGLAVYNGEDYLAEAVDSILSQTFNGFELIICDNASTDRTAEICADYLRKDKRVRYYRNPTNIGGANNENLTFSYARGKYFRWAAHDDVLAPTLLEKCVAVLEQNPEVVLCHTQTYVINAEGQKISYISRYKAQATSPSKRFASILIIEKPQALKGKMTAEAIRQVYGCEETYGLIRVDVLRKTRLQLNYTDSDRTLLAQLSLYGKYYQVPEPLFYKRVHSNMSTRVFPNWWQRMQWFGEQYKNKIILPHWAQFFHYLAVITGAPISILEKVQCYKYMPIWIISDRHWRSLGKDLIVAAYGFFHKLLNRSRI